MSIYLQDAIKIILERRDEKPLDLLNEYFNTTLRGEHILRKHAWKFFSNFQILLFPHLQICLLISRRTIISPVDPSFCSISQ